MQTYEVREGELLVSTDPALLDFDVIHGYLSRSYWTPGIGMEQVRRQIAHSSLVSGLYRVLDRGAAVPGRGELAGTEARPTADQIGFARVLTDFTRFAYLCDVFIVESEQRRGLGQFMLRTLLAHPELVGIRKWLLATKDAHGVYEKLGFQLLPHPDKYMVLKDPAARWL